ncbi:50S ribosomal protein L4 [Patescibacteria group bacterium]|jgi:large subunit ribosomal protein L4|nr:50S ribosomal protein L4 [Patescibacteria group bacterium]
METTVYNTKGEQAGKVTLPEELFALPWNADLVHQVVVAMAANDRAPYAHTKDRSEVAGSNQKPWRQKGTGRARHGQRISPIWRGGGSAHGPRAERDYSQKINTKMRRKALFTVISQKLRDGEVLFVDALSFDAPTTKEAREVIANLATAEGFGTLATKAQNAAVIALPEYDEATAKSFRNVSSVFTEEVRNLNPLQLLQHTYLVIVNPDASLAALAERAPKKVAAEPVTA